MNAVAEKTSAVVSELKRLALENDGLLLPSDVVAAARPSSSPLHSKFEWDDSKAAQQHRLWQARQLIRVCVEQIKSDSPPVEVFVSLTTDRQDGGGYRVTAQVLSDKELREQMLADALVELQVFQNKYARLRELAGVFNAIRKLPKQKK